MSELKNKKNIVVSLIGIVVLGSFLFLLESNATPPALQLNDPVPQTPLSVDPNYQNILFLQEAFVHNVKKVGPAVVSITKLQRARVISSVYEKFHQPPKSWIFKLKQWLKNELNWSYEVEDVGSGIILDQRGHILTNWHILEDADQLRVLLSDGRKFSAKIVGFDSLTDLAVLKIFAFRRLPSAQFGQSDNLKVGEWVMAIGNPYGLNGTVSVGVVSSKGIVDREKPGFNGLIRTDAAINPGGSGGPLINLEGRIVGINTAYTDMNMKWGFTIPIEKAIEISEQLIRNGGVERGWLGIGIQSITPELAALFKLSDQRAGVLVSAVQSSAPAESGGLKQGDIIIQFDGKPVLRTNTFQKWVSESEIGKSVPVQIIRNRTVKILYVTIGRLGS